jgi:hypothetical protein
MTESSDVQRGAALVKDRAMYATKMSSVLVTEDGTNEASIPGFPYKFRAEGDKILVSVDIFKSGYECKECNGKGTVSTKCSCDEVGRTRPGFKYTQEQVDEFDATISHGVAVTRADMACPSCGGGYLDYRKEITCSGCNGKGALLHLADESKTLPTTGVIVSVGEHANPTFKNGMRVLFGCYTGVMIPTKAPGIVFKVLRDIEVLCTIRGGDNLAAFDFLVVDKEL